MNQSATHQVPSVIMIKLNAQVRVQSGELHGRSAFKSYWATEKQDCQALTFQAAPDKVALAWLHLPDLCAFCSVQVRGWTRTRPMALIMTSVLLLLLLLLVINTCIATIKHGVRTGVIMA